MRRHQPIVVALARGHIAAQRLRHHTLGQNRDERLPLGEVDVLAGAALFPLPQGRHDREGHQQALYAN